MAGKPTAAIIAIICASLATEAGAQDRVSLLVGSDHIGAGDLPYNEINPGVFVTWQDLTVGAFENSYSNPSLYAGTEWTLAKHDSLTIAAFAGASLYVTYDRDGDWSGGRIMPTGGLRATYGNAFIQVSPGDMRNFDALVSFGLTFGSDSF
ncbi:hypothetical protein [Yoonia sp. 208BN28-4]|uniref:hypothetical protein n=1 Tax=Yoonia sp. 208BN28-4 TaxID=3126505 RepID=UPI0030A55F17